MPHFRFCGHKTLLMRPGSGLLMNAMPRAATKESIEPTTPPT